MSVVSVPAIFTIFHSSIHNSQVIPPSECVTDLISRCLAGELISTRVARAGCFIITRLMHDPPLSSEIRSKWK